MIAVTRLLAAAIAGSLLGVACSQNPGGSVNAAADKAKESAAAAVDATKATAADAAQKVSDKAQAAADSLKK